MATHLLCDGVDVACLVALRGVAKRLWPLVAEAGLFCVCHLGEVFLYGEEVFPETGHHAWVAIAIVGPNKTDHRVQYLSHVLPQGIVAVALVCPFNQVEEYAGAAFVIDLRLVTCLVVGHIVYSVEEIHLGLSSVVVGRQDTVKVVLVEPDEAVFRIILVVCVFRAIVRACHQEVDQVVMRQVVVHPRNKAEVVDGVLCNGGNERFVQLGVGLVDRNIPCRVCRLCHAVSRKVSFPRCIIGFA